MLLRSISDAAPDSKKKAKRLEGTGVLNATCLSVFRSFPDAVHGSKKRVKGMEEDVDGVDEVDEADEDDEKEPMFKKRLLPLHDVHRFPDLSTQFEDAEKGVRGKLGKLGKGQGYVVTLWAHVHICDGKGKGPEGHVCEFDEETKKELERVRLQAVARRKDMAQKKKMRLQLQHGKDGIAVEGRVYVDEDVLPKGAASVHRSADCKA